MFRGTTPKLTFTLPHEFDISALFITFEQDGKQILEKTLEDVEVEGVKITLSLTQADTLAFTAPSDVKIQIRLKDSEGNAVASRVMKAGVDEILKDGVI